MVSIALRWSLFYFLLLFCDRSPLMIRHNSIWYFLFPGRSRELRKILISKVFDLPTVLLIEKHSKLLNKINALSSLVISNPDCILVDIQCGNWRYWYFLTKFYSYSHSRHWFLVYSLQKPAFQAKVRGRIELAMFSFDLPRLKYMEIKASK